MLSWKILIILHPTVRVVYIFLLICLHVSMCRSRFCPERLDVSLLHPVPDADAGDHVDVFCAV